MIISIISIILTCLIIWRASDGFEAASEYLGRNLNDGVRGATINAIGSSMPELFTTFWFLFALMDRDGFAGGIGTTAGSAIFNGMIIPAIVIWAVVGYGLVNRIYVSKKVILRDGLSLIAAEFILIFLISGDTLYWWHGLILMAVYAIYVVVMLTTMSEKEEGKKDVEDDDDEKESGTFLQNLLTLNLEPIIIRDKINTVNAWILLLITMGIIGGSCALLVYSCEELALGLGIETYFVAVIIASAATSVPDTILSYRDAMAGQYDDAVANALGSNIFDICFALGFPLFIFTMMYGSIEMSPETVENVTELRGLLLILTVFAFFIYYVGEGMGRFKASLLLLIYIGFTFFILAKAYEMEWALDFGDMLRGWMEMVF